MPSTRFPAMVTLALCTAAHGAGRIVITEIMYNPDSNEQGGRSEWVEIANVGDADVAIEDWYLDDEDRGAWSTFSCVLAPGAIAILVNAAAVDEAEFRAAWDERDPVNTEGNSTTSDQRPDRYRVIPLKWGSLSNRPDAENEQLTLRAAGGDVVCEVNFEASGEWPNCSRPDGPSIYLANPSATDINDPANWKRSQPGIDGAHSNAQSEVFNGHDIGSPGFVPGLADREAVAANDRSEPPSRDRATADGPDDDIIDY